MLLLGSISFGFAQDNEATAPKKEHKKISGGFGYFSPGYGLVSNEALNTYVGSSGSSFEDNGITLGGGGGLMIKSIMLGGEGSSFLDQSGNFGNMDLTFHSGSGKFSLGYVVYGRKGLLVYPKLGIGGYNYELTMVNKDAVASVDSAFTGAFTGTSLTRKGTFVSAGVGLDWMPGFDETAGSGLVFGFEAGYNLSINENGWESFGTKLSGGPALLPDGIYFKLHIGFAGWNRQ